MTAADDSGRPRWSASEAAKRCGVGRATIQRRLDAGAIPGAVKTDRGWSIPLDGLLAAGFTPDRPSPPDAAREPVRATAEHDPEHVRAADQLAQRVRDLEQELAASRATAERERVLREGAEQMAAERAGHVEDLRRTLAMLTAGDSSRAQTPREAEQTQQRATERQKGLLGRLGDALRG